MLGVAIVQIVDAGDVDQQIELAPVLQKFAAPRQRLARHHHPRLTAKFALRRRRKGGQEVCGDRLAWINLSGSDYRKRGNRGSQRAAMRVSSPECLAAPGPCPRAA